MKLPKHLSRCIKQGKYIIEFVGFSGIVAFFTLFRAKSASKIGGKFAQWVGPLLPVHRVGMKNLIHIFPNWSHSQRHCVLKKMWFHWGAVCAEYCHLKSLDFKHIEIKGEDLIRSFKDKPCIFISGHFGNFQIISFALQHLGFKVTQVYRQANNPWVDKTMQKFQRQTCNRVVSKENHSVKAIVETLQSHQAVLMLIDQKFSQGPLIPFLRHPAHTTVTPARCAKKYQCPLIPVYAQRLGENRFKIEFYPAIFYKDSFEEMIQRVNERLENEILQNPEQWFWIHKRWPFSYH
ncbi:lipid A biosynthesis (KDO)2-(lauroyl)-lipid IVA acyltransferase [Holospora obtusa F1]|uniref:Lipid A biosynthesis (KDO)2-(Lauroyl)-lipid IVA acyltransferase n=1 Tax=Holospora obtusa F1 TaxID=1399147 RepID=W6TCZ2_HOLOB|nr:lysophospholipid acyltransferase family protein [Holospora obtusa]ETZ06698.1 lipid A biosynthesis (KDO)2-(lauroyl)-lipid IVA acyltransferase [Holospora obtusa F1]